MIPEVVDTYTVSEDKRTYTFVLHRTFRFHNGALVTAESFAAAFNRDAQPKLRSPATGFMQEIVGARAMIDGKAARISGIRVLGRYRLQIRLTGPVGDFTTRLTMGFFCPISPDTPIVETTPAGSGPYYVHERIPNQRIVRRRNPFYRGACRANVDQVVWTIGDSPEACLLDVEQNRIDHCVNSVVGIPPTAYRGWPTSRPSTGRTGSCSSARGCGHGSTRSIMTAQPSRGGGRDRSRRRSTTRSTASRSLVPAGFLAGKRTDQMLPTALARPASIYAVGGPNLVAARHEYAKARYKPPTLVLYTASVPFSVAQAESLKFDLKQLGIDLEVKYFDHAAMFAKVSTRGEPFDLVRQGWVADYADGGNFLATLLDGKNLRPTGNLNQSYFDDPTHARIEAQAGSRERHDARPGPTWTST